MNSTVNLGFNLFQPPVMFFTLIILVNNDIANFFIIFLHPPSDLVVDDTIGEPNDSILARELVDRVFFTAA